MKKYCVGALLSFGLAGVSLLGLIFGLLKYSELNKSFNSPLQWLLIEAVFLFLGIMLLAFGFTLQADKEKRSSRKWTVTMVTSAITMFGCFLTLIIKFG